MEHLAIWISFGLGQFLYFWKRAQFGGGAKVSVFSWMRHNAPALAYRVAILTGVIGGLLANPQLISWLLGLFSVTLSFTFPALPWYFALFIGLFGEAIIIDWLCSKIPSLRTEIPPLNGAS